ncbi:MAG TPA: hypothetical protein PKI19_12865, partial [Elusimicrobiales bacterium]|nr:hypothetical protein [Elusimicrobiales bacterium]
LAENFFHDFAGLAMFLCAGVLLFGILALLNRWLPAAAPRPAWQDRGGRKGRLKVPEGPQGPGH